MTCESYKLLIGPYVDGELLGSVREEIEAHFAVCPRCVALAEELRRLDEAAAGEEVPRVTGEEWSLLWERVRSQSQGEIITLRASTGSRAARWSLAAAAAVAIFALGALVGREFFSTGSPVEEPSRISGAEARKPDPAVAERRSSEAPAPEPKAEADLPSFSSL